MKVIVDESPINLDKFSKFPSCCAAVPPLQVHVVMVRQDALSALLTL